MTALDGTGTAPDGTGWYSVAEAARLLGLKERAIRKRIAAGSLVAERDGGGPWRVQLSAAQTAPHGTGTGTDRHFAAPMPPPIEAAFTGGDENASQPPPVALVPLATMVGELRGLADQLADLARRNEGFALEVGQLRERAAGHEAQLGAKDQTIATQADALADLRRRAEVAEREREELRRRAAVAEAELARHRDEKRAQAAPQPPSTAAPMPAPVDGTAAHVPAGGFWARVRRVFGGEG